MLKRKHEEAWGGEGQVSAATTGSAGGQQSESDDSNCSAGSTDALAPDVSGPTPPKRMKKRVNFQGVTVYYFPRRQGFTCVPSEGGSTLGMSEKHTFTRNFSLSDYTKEQKRIHRAILAEQRRQGKLFSSPLLSHASLGPPEHQDQDVSSGSESDSEYDDYYFLQPLPIRQRRVMLRTSGVKKIDNEEKDECRDIRVSRNVCGCDCKVFCDPATCACSVAGIQCQVDRLSFPCGCTKDGCGNPSGRIEFNPIRVRTHFIHTLMRLELERKDSEVGLNGARKEKKEEEEEEEVEVVADKTQEDPKEKRGEIDDQVTTCAGRVGEVAVATCPKPLKGQLKLIRKEPIDLNLFNSNEKGSCRDCQNTDMCNVMMHDVKFSMVSQHQRQQQQQQQQHQQQRVITTSIGPGQGPYRNQAQLQHHHLSLLQPQPPQQQNTPQQQQHMLLFGDNEEEVYHADNNTSMYFDNEESSYSEMSDGSPDVMETRAFAGISQPSVGSVKFQTHGQSGLFATSITINSTGSGSSSSNSNSSNVGSGGVQQSLSLLSSQNSLLNRSCIPACSLQPQAQPQASCRGAMQQSCGMLAPPIQAAQATGPSLLQPLTGIPGSNPNAEDSSSGAHPQQRSAAARTSSKSALCSGDVAMEIPDSSIGVNQEVTSYQSKPENQELLSSRLSSSSLPGPSYSVTTPLVTTDYVSSTGLLNGFGLAVTASFEAGTSASSSCGAYDALPPPSLTACWTPSLAGQSLPECFGLGTASSTSLAPVSADMPRTMSEVQGSSSAIDLLPLSSVPVVAGSPASPNSTYTTMTTTTRDRLATDCPAISSHMDSRLDPACSKPPYPRALPNQSDPTFSELSPLASPRSETSRLVGDSQSLLLSPYAEAGDFTLVCSSESSRLKTEEVPSGPVGSLPLQEISSTFSSTPASESMSLSGGQMLFSSTAPTLSSSASSSPAFPSAGGCAPSEGDSQHTKNCEGPESAASCFPCHKDLSLGQLHSGKLHPERTFAKVQSCAEVGAESVQSSVSSLMKQDPGGTVSGCQETGRGKEDTLNGCLLLNKGMTAWGEEEEEAPSPQCQVLTMGSMDACEDHKRLGESSVTDSEVSGASSAGPSSSSSSSSSSPTTTMEEKEQQDLGSDFGEVISETIAEMVSA